MNTPKDSKGGCCPPPPCSVRVRIAVAVLPSGKWNACGWSSGKDKDLIFFAREPLEEDGEEYHFIEATLPVPVRVHPETVEADVVSPNDQGDSQPPAR